MQAWNGWPVLRNARVNPVEVLPGCRSVICLSYDYDSSVSRPSGSGSICLYAHGRDYHGILEEKLADLSELLSIYGGEQKGYVDAGPVMERDHAEACGLGWRGRSGPDRTPQGRFPFFYCHAADDAGAGTGRPGFRYVRKLPPLRGGMPGRGHYGEWPGGCQPVPFLLDD